MRRLRLLGDGFGDGRVVVAERADADAGEEVEVGGAVLVEEMDAFAAHSCKRVAGVGLEEEFLFGGLEFSEGGHVWAPKVRKATATAKQKR